MREEMIFLLPIILIDVIGLIITTIGFLILFLEKRKMKNCIAVTEGKVVKYRFIDGIPFPIVEYNVGGRKYKERKHYKGSVTVTSGIFNTEAIAYVDDNDVLHIRRGAFSNLRKVAQELYPMGTYLKVFYNPQKPKQCYVDEIHDDSSSVKNVFKWMGFGFIVLGIIIIMLINVFIK